MKVELIAVGATAAFVGLLWLYVREFPVFSNTIGLRPLLIGSFSIAILGAGALLYALRDRFSPWQRHLPEIFLILFGFVLFAPLFGSLLNRIPGRPAYESFEFVSEMPYLASNYGVLKGEKIEPSGYYLTVRSTAGRLHRFRYRQQAYYPITKSGEQILLPVRKGLLGADVVTLP
jgi:hypothetical protein